MPPLPTVRVADVAPFVHTGLDYFGPLYVKSEVPGVEHVKMWVALFDCLRVRAVHLELAEDSSGNAFLQAFGNFCALRRTPKVILSDNGTNFTFAQPLLGTTLAKLDPEIDESFSKSSIEWHFIPPGTPWYGGANESLVGVVKRVLKRTIGTQFLTARELQRVLYQVADTINSRPITYVPSDEVVQALTPNHFLRLGGSNVNI